MEMKVKATRIKVAPRGWTLDRAIKVSAIEGLALTPRMKRAIASGGAQGRRNVIAASKKP